MQLTRRCKIRVSQEVSKRRTILPGNAAKYSSVHLTCDIILRTGSGQTLLHGILKSRARARTLRIDIGRATGYRRALGETLDLCRRRVRG